MPSGPVEPCVCAALGRSDAPRAPVSSYVPHACGAHARFVHADAVWSLCGDGRVGDAQERCARLECDAASLGTASYRRRVDVVCGPRCDGLHGPSEALAGPALGRDDAGNAGRPRDVLAWLCAVGAVGYMGRACAVGRHASRMDGAGA